MGESTTNGDAHTLRPNYRRVLLKLGGEMFGGGEVGLDPDVVAQVARQIAEVVRSGVQVAVVIGGGNFFRGAQLQQRGMERTRQRLHGHARHGDEQPCAARLPGEGRHRHPGADRDHHGAGRRTVHPAAGPYGTWRRAAW